MSPIETTIIDTIITKTRAGSLKWRAEKDNHYVTINSAKNTRIEVIDIRTGILPVHLFQDDLHLDTIALDNTTKATELLMLIINGRATRLTAFAADI